MAKYLMFFFIAILVLAGAAGVLPAAFSVMMIGAPGATERPATLALVAAVFSFPFVCFASAKKALQCYRSDLTRRAWIFLLLPIVNLIVAGVALAWIQQFQGGKFNG